MKHITIFSLAFLFISAVSPLAESSEELTETILELATLEEDEIDIGRAALLFAKEAYPDLDIEEYSKKIDEMAAAIQRYAKQAGDENDPDHRIRSINGLLYKVIGYHYDQDDLYGERTKNRFLNGLIDSTTGSCFTMPLLYLAIAQRLGYPIYPVSAPQHLFLRYVDPALELQNIEATAGGGYAPDEDYIVILDTPKLGIETGAYLKTMTYKEFLGELFLNSAIHWAKKKHNTKAKIYFEEAFKLNPKMAGAYRIYGQFHLDLAKYDLHRNHDKYFPINQISSNPIIQSHLRNGNPAYRQHLIDKAEMLMRKAEELGAASPLPRNYWLIEAENAKKLSKEVKL